METVKYYGKKALLGAFLLSWARDSVYVYDYATSYYKDDEKAEDDDDMEDTKELMKIIEDYTTDCDDSVIIDKSKYEKALEELKQELKDADPDRGVLTEDDNPAINIMRESILFQSGGRAVMLQLAHPFIASGIRMHSYLENGISTRFYRTFKYMFGMQFGTQEEAFRSSRAVRALHDRVRGDIGEDVGIFTVNNKFDARQRSAIIWVSATLLESSIYIYEMMVQRVSEDDKDKMLQLNRRTLNLFGVVLTEEEKKMNWKQFRKFNSLMWKSKLLTVSESAKDTNAFLFIPPSPIFKPFLDLIEWQSVIMLPRRIAKMYLGRSLTFLDYFCFAIFHGLIKTIYRVCPGDWRYLTAYHNWRARATKEKRNVVSRFIQYCAAAYTNHLLAMAMPERDPIATKKKVQEMAANRIKPVKVKSNVYIQTNNKVEV